MQPDSPRPKFRVNKPLRAVRLEGDSIGEIVDIENGSIVELCGDGVVADLVEILYGKDRLGLFYEDLTYRSERIFIARPDNH